MGLSVAKAEFYFIYVLHLEQGRWYVGSTKDISKRMRTHFSRGGAIATRQCVPLRIASIYRLTDYQIRTDCAHERAEVIVAAQLAALYGAEKVRGGKHGKGWTDLSSPGNLRHIERYSRFARTEDGRRLLAALELLRPEEALDQSTLSTLEKYRERRTLQAPAFCASTAGATADRH